MRICLVLLATSLLVGCTGTAQKAQKTQQIISQAEQQVTPEQFSQLLAKRDGKNYNDPKAVAPYVELFHSIAEKCAESPMLANGFALNLGDEDVAAGEAPDYLGWMQFFSDAADSMDVKPGKCSEIHSHYKAQFK